MVANDITPAVMSAATPEAAATLYRKMAVVMGTVTRLAKTGKNPHFGYTFATAQDVADAIRSALAEQGVAFFVSMYNVRQKSVTRKSQKGERQLIRTKAAFSFTFACGDTGATYTSAWEAEAEDDGDKGINKCATAAEKYFLMKTFIMSAGDEVDADGDKPTHNPKPRQQPAPASTNGNSKAWYKSADNVQLIAVRIADEFNLELNPSDILTIYLPDGKPLEDYATGKEAHEAMRNNAIAECLRAFVAPQIVTTASGEPVDTATGEILTPPAEDDRPAPKAFTFPSWFEAVRNTIVEWPHFQGKKNTTPSARRIHASNAINELLKDGILTMDMAGQNALDILKAKYQPEANGAMK